MKYAKRYSFSHPRVCVCLLSLGRDKEEKFTSVRGEVPKGRLIVACHPCDANTRVTLTKKAALLSDTTIT